MIVAKMARDNTAVASGLMQWDYGQDLLIEGITTPPDGTQVQFYQGLLAGQTVTKSGKVRIPDAMLQHAAEITAYVYLRTDSSGETVLKIRLPVTARPRPTDYVLPEYVEYTRLLPEGGKPGQVPVVAVGKDGQRKVVWAAQPDGLSLNADGELVLTAGGVAVGERVRLPTPREVELRNTGEALEWRYTDSNEWHTLFALGSLVPEFEVDADGNLWVISPYSTTTSNTDKTEEKEDGKKVSR